ncbi:penicillin-binding protein 1A [Candidatus Nitrosacidococcus tergens]|uniref:Penicillin-binding protein 1A n=1 Tax=Candidatus Nitrosacidococcus tergens TaxID=553981 RepID=A0A7G1Q731_9GAMM|nr:penicillin-binding protein 1A [Candidatus Nitrosacidococcus tergens]CAB1274228.1 fused penicillin-binding protein 1a: murein transglycosylase; murein transpeptidase [Candidatus Nitrosacidococcus tergens]
MAGLLFIFRWVFNLTLAAALFIFFAAIGIYFYLTPQLPPIDALKDIQLQVPLRIFSKEKKLIAEYGDKHRIPLTFEQIPPLMVKAILAAEDDRFYEHPGVDYQGILRAAYYLLKTGRKAQGGSTITMQVARNFFLSREKTYLRKLQEILLAFQIEQKLSKNEIITLYLNKIYLGNRAYGVGAAAQVYYGTTIDQLTLPQFAMIAGLPKAPSGYNPVVNPTRALQRRNYVLHRMYEVGYITEKSYKKSVNTIITAKYHKRSIEVQAPFIAEMVRVELSKKYGADIYTAGYNVYTTIQAQHQKSANRALYAALLSYDKRHGYRGSKHHVDISDNSTDVYNQVLDKYYSIERLHPGIVLKVGIQSAQIYIKDKGKYTIPWSGLSWAQPYIDINKLGQKPTQAADILNQGDIIWVESQSDSTWKLAQIPEVEGALVSLSPTDGAITALSGGFDFNQSKFNRVIQSKRQPGSSFKPFLYSAALEKGYTAASVVNDSPIVIDEPQFEKVWRPKNYNGRFFGPTRLRVALTHSRNLVSIRLLRDIGIDYTIDYIERFGFTSKQLPKSLSLALGSGDTSPLEMARGFAVFANEGFLITPYFINQIETSRGEVIFHANPPRICQVCKNLSIEGKTIDTQILPIEEIETAPIAPRVITPQNAYIINTMLQDVIRIGTGQGAKILGRSDIAGKTGTTNNQYDAWFAGFNPDIVAVSWVGFDQPESLGNLETGARVALPMWVDYMSSVLKDIPSHNFIKPSDIVTIRIDPTTGLLAGSNSKGIFEVFSSGHIPTEYVSNRQKNNSSDLELKDSSAIDQLF